MVHRNSGEALRIHETESFQVNVFQGQWVVLTIKNFRLTSGPFYTNFLGPIQLTSGFKSPEYFCDIRVRESSIVSDCVGRFGRKLAEISPTIQAYNASYSVWPKGQNDLPGFPCHRRRTSRRKIVCRKPVPAHAKVPDGNGSRKILPRAFVGHKDGVFIR